MLIRRAAADDDDVGDDMCVAKNGQHGQYGHLFPFQSAFVYILYKNLCWVKHTGRSRSTARAHTI